MVFDTKTVRSGSENEAASGMVVGLYAAVKHHPFSSVDEILNAGTVSPFRQCHP